jgi:ATP-dependent DNA ligase
MPGAGRFQRTSDFEALRSRHGQAEAILVAYDLMEANGQDIRPEPLETAQEKATPNRAYYMSTRVG